jgi:hypothetical protein
MQALGFKQVTDLEAIAAGDRKSARDMQTTTRSWVPPTLAVLITVGYFGILIGMLTEYLQAADSQVLLMMLGSLTTAFGLVLSFYFGTTANSQHKDVLLANSTPLPK